MTEREDEAEGRDCHNNHYQELRPTVPDSEVKRFGNVNLSGSSSESKFRQVPCQTASIEFLVSAQKYRLKIMDKFLLNMHEWSVSLCLSEISDYMTF